MNITERERVIVQLIKYRIRLDEIQSIFIVKQVQDKYLAKNKPLYLAFIDLEKTLDKVLHYAIR